VSIGQLIDSLPFGSEIDGRKSVPFEIITRSDNYSITYVDVSYRQMLEENREAVFQVASNFNGVECISSGSSPDSKYFTQNYIYDRTQGPIASISAGAGAITRVHAAFYDSKTTQDEWQQTKDHQIEFLGELSEHFPVENGYVCLTGKEPEFPELGSPESQELFLKAKIGYHKDQQVTTGPSTKQGFVTLHDPAQKIDQVLCAALNVSQGYSGMRNAHTKGVREKCKFILDLAYEGTYLSAIANNRKTIFLTLIGGGVFGNLKSWIYSAIIEAHLKWACNKSSSLEKVVIPLFSTHDVWEPFTKVLKSQRIPYNWYNYEKGKKSLIDSFEPSTIL